MGLLDSYKANKAIANLLAAPSNTSSEAKMASQRLKEIGPSAIPALINAMDEAAETEDIERLLRGFLTRNTLQDYIQAWSEGDRHIQAAITRILKSGQQYDANSLLDLLEDPDIPKIQLAEVLMTHVEQLRANTIVSLLISMPSGLRALAYPLLDKLITDQNTHELLRLKSSNEAALRVYVARLFGKFNNEMSRDTLMQLLVDENKHVRAAALDGIANLNMAVPIKAVVNLLRDPDLTVQGKAIESLIKINDPTTVKYLIEILQDESEYIRRAAVEVLNEVGDQNAITDLLNALRDQDWWVKVRAADALGTIGGPRVVDAILELIKDEDEFLRRTAVEILNSSKDERAIDHLIAALKDEDWWVRERAADALSAMGNEKALQPLRKMLLQGPEACKIAMRALASLNDVESVEELIRLLQSSDNDVRKEALRSLAKLTDSKTAETVQIAVTRMENVNDEELKTLLMKTNNELKDKFGDKTVQMNRDGTATPTHTSSVSQTPVFNTVETASINLDPGSLVDGRYEIIRKIGRGGFGVVMLVNDKIVNDEFILKFLHTHLSNDENMIERFTHELRYTRRITHPHIIRIYDFLALKSTSSYAISMEYFPSHSMADEMAGNKILDIDRIVMVCAQICDGMSAAQKAHVIHRDLKPANILINDENNVKIVDFGLAAAASHTDSRITKSGILIGTPTYMSPEQARGKKIDSRTDIYSLGILMYGMAAGRPPYKGNDAMAILFQHAEGKAKLPSAYNPDIPDELEAIIMKAMAHDPDDRYQTFIECRESLLAYQK
ncbi:MAG TPA: serine/threonine protein kinase, partial [Gammaproteobacteria bacterium]|nr:serine/threonine protein kinase [Gammaproteobacteria bacterium]